MGNIIEAPVQTAPVESTPVSVQIEVPQASAVELMDQLTNAAITGDTREVERLSAMIDQASSKPPAPKEETPAPVAEQPPAPELPPVEAPIAETVETPKPTEQVEEPHKDQERFRFKADEDKAVAMMAKSENISLVEAARRYEAMKETAKPKEEQPAPVVDQTLIGLESEVATLEAGLDEIGANEGLFNADAAKLTKALSKANARLESYRGSQAALAAARETITRTDQAKTQAQVQELWKANEAEAAKAFPDSAKPDSALNLMMLALNERMKNPAHPDHGELLKSSAPLWLAKKAAEVLGVKSGAATPPPAPTVIKDPPVARPAPGSRASAPVPPAMSDTDKIQAKEAQALDAITGGGRVSRRSAHATIFI